MKTTDLVRDCTGYGKVLCAWQGTGLIQRGTAAGPALEPTTFENAAKFTGSVYALIETTRPLTVYRFAETAGLVAPYGTLHDSYLRGMVAGRNPAQPMGGWWSPMRPSLLIDGLAYGSDLKREVRGKLAVLKEWNRFDVCIEAILEPGSQVYGGRVAPQAENRAFETAHGRTILYGGGAMQFLLTRDRSMVTPMRQYDVT